MQGMDEYASIYWAAACLVFWAGCGVSDVQFAKAVQMVCEKAGLSVVQEILLKDIAHKMKEAA